MLTGAAEPERMIARLLTEGGRTVVVTLGASGILAQARGEPRPCHWPAPSVQALDTSGAGDVFCGALAARLSRGDGFDRAVRLAVAASALAVTRPGTFGCGPSAAEFSTLLERESA
jgi:ribokinase